MPSTMIASPLGGAMCSDGAEGLRRCLLPAAGSTEFNVVIALKGTFAYEQDDSQIPEFALACLMLLANGRFALMRMADPLRSWIQTVTGNTLQTVAARAQEKFGEQV